MSDAEPAAAQPRVAEVSDDATFWLSLAAQKRRLGLAARRLLADYTRASVASLEEMQLLALKGVPDLPAEWMNRLAHGALVTQGAESWNAKVRGHTVHRYAFAGKGKGPAVLLLHGLGGSSSSMAPVLPGLAQLVSRVELLDLPGHGRSEVPKTPLSAREYADVLIGVIEELARQTGGKVVLIGNSLGGALALLAAQERPELIAGVVGLNPAGAQLSEEALHVLPRAFADPNEGAARMAQLLFHRTPWLFWLVARDFARNWSSPTVQRILDDARAGVLGGAGADRSLGPERLAGIRAPVLILWGQEDRLLPSSSPRDFARYIPGAKVELIPGCGHIPQVERPALTRRRVRAFLTRL